MSRCPRSNTTWLARVCSPLNLIFDVFIEMSTSCEQANKISSSFLVGFNCTSFAVFCYMVLFFSMQQCNNELQQLISSSLRCLKGPPPPVAGVGPSLGHPSVIGLCHSRWRLPPAHYFSGWWSEIFLHSPSKCEIRNWLTDETESGRATDSCRRSSYSDGVTNWSYFTPW